jgi:iron complex transport system ATP-binding protein
LDEPTTHLDISNQLEILDLIKQLSEEKNLLVVAVFHDFNLAARYCDSIILMKEGKIVDVGQADETLTSENVKKVFSVDTLVKKHPITGQLHVIPISRPLIQKQKSLTVHLISGNGTGSPVMKTLLDEGYRVTAGVLNLLDTDQETAQLLGIPTTNEAPFSPITKEAHKANLKMISQANILVVTPTQFGEGNMRNLDAVEEAMKYDLPVVLYENCPISERDFTGGTAAKYLEKFKANGAVTVCTIKELVSFLDDLEIKKVELNK